MTWCFNFCFLIKILLNILIGRYSPSFPNLENCSRNLDMQELDYNPSKKDLTDARIHHLLAEELKPYKRVSVECLFCVHMNGRFSKEWTWIIVFCSIAALVIADTRSTKEILTHKLVLKLHITWFHISSSYLWIQHNLNSNYRFLVYITVSGGNKIHLCCYFWVNVCYIHEYPMSMLVVLNLFGMLCVAATHHILFILKYVH